MRLRHDIIQFVQAFVDNRLERRVNDGNSLIKYVFFNASRFLVLSNV